MFSQSFRRLLIFLSLLTSLMLVVGGSISAQPTSESARTQAAPLVSDASFRSSPFMFIENDGQWENGARFQLLGGNNSVAASSSPAWYVWGPGDLADIAVLSASDAWGVGSNGMIRHWNGQDWIQVASPVSAFLNAVAFTSPSDGWAVGNGGVIIRWDGSQWRSFAGGPPSTVDLYDVVMLLPNRGWAVGVKGWWSGSAGSPLMLSWDGSAWREVALPASVAQNSDHALESAVIASPAIPSPNSLDSITMVSQTDGWVVGAGGKIYRWNGTSWNRVSSPTSWHLHSVSMSSANDGWAVAGNLYGLCKAMLHWDGYSWRFVSCPVSEELLDVFMVSQSDGWAVGYKGTILHWDGIKWTAASTPTDEGLGKVVMVSPSDGWIAGQQNLLRYGMAPVTTYSVSGRVTDASGHGIPGVTVSAGFPRLTSTGTDGNYSLTGLSAGSYNVYAYLSPYSFSPASIPVTVPGNAVSINFTAAPATVTEIEINQALGKQLYDETRYVAGKNTAIRVWLSVPVRVDEEQQLTVRQTDPPFATTLLRPAERDGERSAILTFLCPAASCAGGLQGAYAFEASVNGATSVRSADFLARNTIRVLAVPVKVKDGNQVKHLHPIQWADSWRFLAQVYPVAEDGIDWTVYPEELDGTRYDLTDGGECGRDPIWMTYRCTGRLGLLDALRGLQSPECSADPLSSPDCYDKIIGFIPTVSTCNNSCNCPYGWAESSKWRVPAVVMVDGVMKDACIPSGQFSIGSMRSSIAHEVGHTYGLGDEYDIPGTGYACDVNPPPPTYPTGSPSGHCTLSTEEPWPYGDGSGSLVSVTKARPFELVSTMQNVAERGELTDKVGFMGNPSYQRDAWVTPRSYRYLFIKIGAPAVATASADAASERVAWLSGAITQDGEVRLAPGYSFTGMPPVLDSGRYSLDVLDASNTTLATQQFDVSFTDLSNPPEPLIQAPLNVSVRLPTGAVRIRVRDGAAVLLTTSVSPHTPTVAVTSPTAGSILAGMQTVAWQASDTDLDQLYYTIEYTQPSRAHLTLASNITATQLQVDFDYLPGGSAGEIRVWATDGINSTKTTVGGLVVAPKQPQVFISTPIDGGTYPLGSSVALSGSAYDPQDGWLRSSAALAWYSDQNGLLGHGGTVYVKTLAEGPHTITLHATNSAGMTVVGSARIFVGAKLYLPLISRGM